MIAATTNQPELLGWGFFGVIAGLVGAIVGIFLTLGIVDHPDRPQLSLPPRTQVIACVIGAVCGMLFGVGIVAFLYHLNWIDYRRSH